jgi:hypothetical protein
VSVFARCCRLDSITRLIKDNTACSQKTGAASCELVENFRRKHLFEWSELWQLADEVYFGAVGNDATVVTHFQQLANGIFAVFAVVEGALVDVHAYEAVG